ncbi:hypothetical protein QFC22_000521 [Naganishia vaughanmartiniae]|uniref:Uncharacterized protein n=1 Tax=Naganishia vaughanmartiniae TaxID=1424756 RepID=A0ACC2XNA3_9TREE|nr:hypothetical protein QFC22_000521 [Naganishia vaughanmartiniae]
MALFRSSAPSYAYEELNHSLTALSTIPVSIPATLIANEHESSSSTPVIRAALRDLSASKPITRSKLVNVLKTIADTQEQHAPGAASSASGLAAYNAIDKVMEAEIMARAVTVLWREALDTIVEGALALERERVWWEAVVGSSFDISLYFIQSFPLRILRLVPRPLRNIQLRIPPLPSASQLFRQTSAVSALSSLRTLPAPITNPLALTRREILSSLKVLKIARDDAAQKIGFLSTHGPRWDEDVSKNASEDNLQAIVTETSRIYALVCVALDIPMPISPIPTSSVGNNNNSTNSSPAKRSRSHPSSIQSSPSGLSAANSQPKPTAQTLLPILQQRLPSLLTDLRDPLRIHGRPSRLTRLWIPLLMLPPLIRYTSGKALDNQAWIRSQLQNTRETVSGWVIQWVWEPLMDVTKTLRTGGEGLGVEPTTVDSDKASLERMVLDLGKDHYHLQGEALDALGEKVRHGNMEDVLKVYETEMKASLFAYRAENDLFDSNSNPQSPLKNALMGSLVRTLLIQVQKTKTDLSLSLLSLDHLLRSQQLTFAFVGLAPSLLVLYGIGGWAKRAWNGENRGKSRRMAYVRGIRDVERMLLTAGKVEQEMSDRERGLLILSVGGMRAWAAGLRGQHKEDFMDDLRLLESAKLGRKGKLRVVDRIWRGWGVDGRGTLGK